MINKVDLVMISIGKYALQVDGLQPALRLRFLQVIDNIASRSDRLSPEVVSMIEPACDNALTLWHELFRLGPAKAFEVLHGKPSALATFLQLNPSINAAAEAAELRWRAA
jgi:hypothetical protein